MDGSLDKYQAAFAQLVELIEQRGFVDLGQEGRYREAENFFQAAARGDDKDARYHYFLGLSHWAQGKHETAAEQFRRGAKLEQENKPSQVFIQLALDQLPREARRALNRYRP